MEHTGIWFYSLGRGLHITPPWTPHSRDPILATQSSLTLSLTQTTQTAQEGNPLPILWSRTGPNGSSHNPPAQERSKCFKTNLQEWELKQCIFRTQGGGGEKKKGEDGAELRWWLGDFQSVHAGIYSLRRYTRRKQANHTDKQTNIEVSKMLLHQKEILQTILATSPPSGSYWSQRPELNAFLVVVLPLRGINGLVPYGIQQICQLQDECTPYSSCSHAVLSAKGSWQQTPSHELRASTVLKRSPSQWNNTTNS